MLSLTAFGPFLEAVLVTLDRHSKVTCGAAYSPYLASSVGYGNVVPVACALSHYRSPNFVLLQDPYPDKSLKALEILDNMFKWLVRHAEARRQAHPAADAAHPAADNVQAVPSTPAAAVPGVGPASEWPAAAGAAGEQPPAVSAVNMAFACP